MTEHLHHVWNYTEVDRAFWMEHLEGWLPEEIIDAHVHIIDPGLRTVPMTEAMRRQYWVNEVFEPIDAAGLQRCYDLVFPRRKVRCLAFGIPDLDFDLDRGNVYVQEETMRRGWWSLAVIRPQWPVEKVERLLSQPGVIGVKPYYSLIDTNRETRDAFLEASIFQFLPHHILELLDARGSWVTLHVPKAARLGHPQNTQEIREIRRRYPKIRLVIAHLGRCYTEEHAREGLTPWRDDPDIFFDTSAVLNPASHRVALELFGADRIIYGTDNPIMFMRGRRQYQSRSYLNRTNYPFFFNKEREPAEIEARYTLFMYEDLLAIKQACHELGITGKDQLRAIFCENAKALIQQSLKSI